MIIVSFIYLAKKKIFFFIIKTNTKKQMIGVVIDFYI